MSPTTSDFTLKNMTLNPELPPPSIEVIFVAGYGLSLRTVCERFSRDFDCHFVSVFDYLTSLRDSHMDDEERQQALGVLHPSALADMLRHGPDSQIPPFFLIPILLNKIDSYVRNGYHGFLIAGLGEDMETWVQFAQKIAAPSAIFSFNWDHTKTTERRPTVEETYPSITITIRGADEDEDEVYRNLLGAIAERAWKK